MANPSQPTISSCSAWSSHVLLTLSGSPGTVNLNRAGSYRIEYVADEVSPPTSVNVVHAYHAGGRAFLIPEAELQAGKSVLVRVGPSGLASPTALVLSDNAQSDTAAIATAAAAAEKDLQSLNSTVTGMAGEVAALSQTVSSAAAGLGISGSAGPGGAGGVGGTPGQGGPGGGPSGAGGNGSYRGIAGVQRALDLVTEYPVITANLAGGNGDGGGYTANGYSSNGSSGNGSSIDVLARNTIRDVLGWKLNADDPQQFVGALTQAFELKTVENHVVWNWKPRSYAVSTHLSEGITGAQASVYARAQSSLDSLLPLLDGLYPLTYKSKPEDAEAIRSLVRAQAIDLVGYIGALGGPVIARVEQSFTLLLGEGLPFKSLTGFAVSDPDLVGGQLGSLRQEFGLRTQKDPANVEASGLANTTEDEMNVTQFRMVADYLTGILVSWISNRTFFQRGASGTQPFFGTQLVLLQRQLSAIGDLVDDLRCVLRSVFIADEETETLQISFPATIVLPNPAADATSPLNNTAVDQDPMFLSELLDWVTTFATDDGPNVIKVGGKFAVAGVFLPTAIKLRNLVLGAVGAQGMPSGYYTPRVRRAVEEIGRQLDRLAALSVNLDHPIPSPA